MQDVMFAMDDLAALDETKLLRTCVESLFRDRVAVVSSFGAESAVLLAMVADIDTAVPVLFIDTRRHFPETLDYRDELVAHLGLRDVRTLMPDAAELAREDPANGLAAADPDACCAMRKVAPLAAGLRGFDAWISGRKRYQSAGRAALPAIERVDGQFKINPLARWSAADIAAEHDRRGLPRHPLVAFGYGSVGCAPCTRPLQPGEAGRDGRWAGFAKTECGIHRGPDGQFLRG